MEKFDLEYLKNFTTNNTKETYTEGYLAKVSIDTWLNYVSHITNIMQDNPNIRFSVDGLLILNIFNLHYNDLTEYKNEVIVPENFTINVTEVLFDSLGLISLPKNLIIKGSVRFYDTFLSDIPINLFGAEYLEFSSSWDKTSKFKKYYYKKYNESLGQYCNLQEKGYGALNITKK